MTPKNAIRLARETLAGAFDLELDEKHKRMVGDCPRSDEAAAAYNLLAMLNIEDLLEDSEILQCLRNAGVDNWDGWSDAMEEFHTGYED